MSDIKKIDFLHGRHKKLWDILSKWKGEDTEEFERQLTASNSELKTTVWDLGYIRIADRDKSFTCGIVGLPQLYGKNLAPCSRCPLAWTDRDGNPAKNCGDIVHMWMISYGKEKKKFARMIRDMPLIEDAGLFYNIVE